MCCLRYSMGTHCNTWYLNPCIMMHIVLPGSCWYTAVVPSLLEIYFSDMSWFLVACFLYNCGRKSSGLAWGRFFSNIKLTINIKMFCPFWKLFRKNGVNLYNCWFSESQKVPKLEFAAGHMSSKRMPFMRMGEGCRHRGFMRFMRPVWRAPPLLLPEATEPHPHSIRDGSAWNETDIVLFCREWRHSWNHSRDPGKGTHVALPPGRSLQMENEK